MTLERLLPREKLRGAPAANPTSYPSGRLWPHGEWSLGYGRRRPDGGDWHDDPFVGLGVDDVAMARRASGGPPPLNLRDAPNSHTPIKRGKNGITGYGQQMVKAAGFLMGQRWPQHRKTLGTITLPPMPIEARREVVEAWPELTRHLLQWLSRRLERQELPLIVCSVTEVQPERLSSLDEGYLHFHALWLNHPGKSGNWSVDPCDVRAWLSQWLYKHIPSYQGGHVNVNVKPVRGEAARYLAKYMSKGKQQVAEAMDDWGEDVCPSTWWNMTKPARDMVKAATHQGEVVGAALESALETAWTVGPYVIYAYLKHIEIDFEGARITVGWRGRFLPDVDRRFRQGLESAYIS